MPIDIFDEFDEGPEDFNEHRQSQERLRRHHKVAVARYEVGNPVPTPPEILEARMKYRNDFVLMHQEIFPHSTGIKPFGPDQEKAIRRFQKIAQKTSGGKLVQAEPRGFAKTSRAVNQILYSILCGDIRFGLLVSSEISKSEDIMEQVQTELMTNDKLLELFPNVMACIQHMEGKASKTKNQTMCGEPTFMAWTSELIRFPTVPGEPSSGAFLMVRTKDNLRGISKKVRYGPDAGNVLRPDFVLLDDIQTDKDAKSPTVCWNICNTIKRSVLFGGSHSKKVRAIMTITPNRKGDVASHFILREPSWEVALYGMIKQMPERMDLWDEFGRKLLNFDKYKEGDRERAQRRASAFVKDNYEEMHKGSKVSWDWAYEWAVDDPVELSALHHGMVFLYEEGEEAFNYECQCKLDPEENASETLVAPIETIISRVAHTPRMKVPKECKHIVTHVDMNDEILSYVTLASGDLFQPIIIDYGTYPPQPTTTWKKGSLINPLQKLYPDIPRGSIGTLFYRAILDFSKIVVNTLYEREDGVQLQNRWVGFDAKYQTDDILRGIRESDVRAFLIATQGLFFGHKGKPIMELPANAERELHYHCYTSPSTDRTVSVLRIDTNYIKTLIHRGFLLSPGNVGTFRLFKPLQAWDHQLIAQHCVAEFPTQMVNIKEERVVVEWEQFKDRDNEYFDNIVHGVALLFKCGCSLKKDSTIKIMDIQDWIDKQKGK
jgi:hypothetical protein